GVEGDQTTAGHARSERTPPARVREHALEEVLSVHRIVEAGLLLDREKREALHQRAGEEAGAAPRSQTLRTVDRHARLSAAGRILLEHVAGELEPGELGDAPMREAGHRLRQITAAPRRDQPRPCGVPFEPDRLAWNAEPDLDL